MQNILIIFGGRSVEHEVSIRSARNIITALDKKIYRPVLVVISRTGNWYLLNNDNIPANITEVNEELSGGFLCTLMRKPNETVVITENGKTIRLDAAFPALHGTMCEDGTLQGMFETLMLPYVGAGVLGSAIGMDKEILKQRLEANNVLTTPYLAFSNNDAIPSFKDATSKLKSDILFVKPALAGSSVGVSKVRTEEEYKIAVAEAFKYSFKILIEQFAKGREVECSVLGNNNPAASCIGEIKPNHDFYSYEAKYLDPNGADIIIPAQNFSNEIVEKVRALSVKAFKAAECRGLARVDFFVTDNDEIFVNELNTIPGFTSISMYPKMWEASGISYTDLITQLIELGKEEFLEKQKLKLSPDINVKEYQV